MPQTEKQLALEALQQRKANKPPKVDNASLPAGSPMYFYCKICGHVAAVLPEDFMSTPPKLCENCAFLKEMGWLND